MHSRDKVCHNSSLVCLFYWSTIFIKMHSTNIAIYTILHQRRVISREYPASLCVECRRGKQFSVSYVSLHDRLVSEIKIYQRFNITPKCMRALARM